MKWFRISSTIVLVAGALGIILMQRATLKRIASVNDTVGRLEDVVSSSTHLGWRAAGAASVERSARAGWLSRDELRLLLREELSAHPADCKLASTTVPDEAPPAASESPERIEAFQRAEHKVNDILTAQIVGQDQLMELRALDANLTIDQIDELHRRLIVAANSGQLRVTTPHPMF